MPATPADDEKQASSSLRRRFESLDRLLTPPWLRWDPDTDHDLTWGLNMLYGFAACFSVANLYYNHPILHVLADSFHVSDERASLVPTVMQAGYAGGLLFLIPLGDIVHRRLMILMLCLVCALIWLGLTLTTSFSVFLALSFLVGLLTVTPQLMFPLASQYAPARHRAIMISIVMSGLVFGILVARLLSGIVANYTGWRAVYWMSFGLQIATFIGVFLFMPDYPILRHGTSYPRILRKILTLPFRHPILTQHSIIAFLNMGMFTLFWTTLTFQLSGPPFNLSTLDIGLFALIGISPVLLNPLISRFLTSRLHPSGTLLIALFVTLASVCIGTFVGTFSLAGPVIWAFLGDLGMNTSVVANRMAFAHVEPTAQNAVNSVYMVLTFCGQLFGTGLGNHLYAIGGWKASGGLAIGMIGLALCGVVVRGPHETGWLGWRGGWNLRDMRVGEKTATGAGARRDDDVEANTAGGDTMEQSTVVAGDTSVAETEEPPLVDEEKGDEAGQIAKG